MNATDLATESLVLRDDMLTLFRDLAQTGARYARYAGLRLRPGGLDAEFVPQSDPWR